MKYYENNNGKPMEELRVIRGQVLPFSTGRGVRDHRRRRLVKVFCTTEIPGGRLNNCQTRSKPRTVRRREDEVGVLFNISPPLPFRLKTIVRPKSTHVRRVFNPFFFARPFFQFATFSLDARTWLAFIPIFFPVIRSVRARRDYKINLLYTTHCRTPRARACVCVYTRGISSFSSPRRASREVFGGREFGNYLKTRNRSSYKTRFPSSPLTVPSILRDTPKAVSPFFVAFYRSERLFKRSVRATNAKTKLARPPPNENTTRGKLRFRFIRSLRDDAIPSNANGCYRTKIAFVPCAVIETQVGLSVFDTYFGRNIFPPARVVVVRALSKRRAFSLVSLSPSPYTVIFVFERPSYGKLFDENEQFKRTTD